MQTIVSPEVPTRRTEASIEAIFVKRSHAEFLVNGELRPSLTLAKLIEAAGLSLEVGDRVRIDLTLEA